MTDFSALASEASTAFAEAEPGLRLLGAFGEIGLGMDPDAPDDSRWWAHCFAGGDIARKVNAPGFPSPKAALDDLRRQLSAPATGLYLG